MYTLILPPVSFVPAAVVRHPGKGSLKKERVNSAPRFHRIAHHCREIKQQGLETAGHIQSEPRENVRMLTIPFTSHPV